MRRKLTTITEPRAFGLAVAILLIPVWGFEIFATHDGPAHLYNARLILQLFADPNAWFSDWVEFNPRIDPTWGPHLLLAALVALLPLDLAEKVFQSACVVMLPLAARYLLGGIRQGAQVWAWLTLPMSYSFTFHLGFYSFCLGLSVSMIMVGYWARQREGWTIRTIIVQALLALAAFFTHVFAFLALGIVMALPALVRLAEVWRQRGIRWATRACIVPWALAFAPALILAAEFLLARESEYYPAKFEWRLKALAQFSALQSFSNIEAIQSVAVVLVLFIFACLALYRLASTRDGRAAAWLGSVFVILVIAIFMPESRIISDNGMKGGAYLVPRTGIIFYLSALLMTGAALGMPRWPRVVATTGVVLALLGFGLRWPYYQVINAQLLEYRSAQAYVSEGESVIALNVEQGSFLDVRRAFEDLADPTIHEVNRIAARVGAFSWNNYQGRMGYFPIQFKPGFNPYLYLGRLEAEPPEMDLSGFEHRLGRPVDVLLLWFPQSQRADASGLLAQIDAAGFRRVHVSGPQGLMWVYRRPD